MTIILIMILIHWIADFVFQTHWQAMNKSTNNEALFRHVAVYTACWLPFSIVLWGGQAWKFLLITFLAHFVTDYYTSRLNSYLWKKGDVHNFFVSVGFDQVLHYLQLFLTYELLNLITA